MQISMTEASRLLIEGHVVAVPTETVYGLAASIHQPKAVEQIFTLKGRPSDNPLIIHLSSFDQLSLFTTVLPPRFKDLAKNFWPGPLTLVMSIDPLQVPNKVRAGLSTAAFRIPEHPQMRELIQLTGPLVIPSANLSGKPSSTCLSHVEEDFGADFPILDGGKSRAGVESTILFYDKDKWKVGRQGALPPEAFAKTLGYTPEISAPGSKPLCPGQMYRHYAPQAKLYLTPECPPHVKHIIGFEDRKYKEKALLLGHSQDPQSAAHHLYDTLRSLDKQKVKEAWVDTDFPKEGLWLTVWERLQKAASS